MIARHMNSRKTARLAAIALLALALGLAWKFAPATGSASAGKEPDAAGQATATPKPTTEARAANEPPRTQEPTAPLSRSDTAPETKLSERKETMSIRDLEKHGIVVEAEHVGKNSASGKVRITVQGGAVLEADQAKMSPNGMLVAEGNPTVVHGEQRMSVSGENPAMAIYFDEEKQSVIVRGASADRVTKAPSEDEVTDPDRNGTK